jgi:hypothetical protein
MSEIEILIKLSKWDELEDYEKRNVITMLSRLDIEEIKKFDSLLREIALRKDIDSILEMIARMPRERRKKFLQTYKDITELAVKRFTKCVEIMHYLKESED